MASDPECDNIQTCTIVIRSSMHLTSPFYSPKYSLWAAKSSNRPISAAGSLGNLRAGTTTSSTVIRLRPELPSATWFISPGGWTDVIFTPLHMGCGTGSMASGRELTHSNGNSEGKRDDETRQDGSHDAQELVPAHASSFANMQQMPHRKVLAACIVG